MKYLEQYKQIHRGKKYGISGDQLVEPLSKIITKHKSLLDFGAGQSNTATKLSKLLGIESVVLYDPAVIGRDMVPLGAYDTVICTDVMEHVPEEEVSQVLTDIWGYTEEEGEAIFVIALRLAGEVLPNGDNAHCTVQPKEWWESRLREVFVNVSPLPTLSKNYCLIGYKCTKGDIATNGRENPAEVV